MRRSLARSERSGRWRRTCCLLVATLALPVIGWANPASASAAATTCGYSAYHNSTFSYAGINLFRHEARGTVCENNVNIVDVRPYVNKVVKVGVGNGYTTSAWHSRGFVPAKNTFDNLHGRAGLTVNLPLVGTVGVSRTRRATFNWAMSGTGARYSFATSGWQL